MEQSKKIFYTLAVVVTGLVIGAVVYMNPGFSSDDQEIKQDDSQEVAEKALEYINQNLLQQGLIASLVDIEEIDGVFKVHFAVNEQEHDAYVTENGKLLFTQFFDLESAHPVAQKQAENQDEKTIGGFFKSEDDVCAEDGKPIVYFFGSEGCGACKWERPVIASVMAKFEGFISFRNNIDSTADRDIFTKYSDGHIPTLVLGCQYYRVGSGANMGEEQEIKILTALTCKLTNNQPAALCEPVLDLINKI